MVLTFKENMNSSLKIAGRPVRTCTSCGKRKEKDRLFRYVWRAGSIVADRKQVLPGRGAYCCMDKGCVDLLQKRKKKWKRLFRL
jgi:predicted RNA-binding protein YlxR (DUF448 family)